MGKRTLAAALGLAAMITVSLLPARAEAHAIGLSTGEYAAKGDAVQVKLAFARGEVAGLLPGLDDNHDGHVTAIEVDAAKKALETTVLAKIHVTAGGAACTPVLTAAGLTEADGLTVDGRFDCARSSQAFDVDVALLDDLSHGHRHVARAVGTTTHDEVLYKGHATFSIAPLVGAGADQPGAPGAAEPASATREGGAAAAWAFFKMGIEHILTGYDHLVFLFGLVLLRAKTKELLAVVTAFTVAHSITLALAAFRVVTLPAALVEPAIALSIAWVAARNLWQKDGRTPWIEAFLFGLIHGLGFAGAIGETLASEPRKLSALVGFNLGVEFGQVAVVAALLAVFALVRAFDSSPARSRRERSPETIAPRWLTSAASFVVAVLGVYWFVQRVAG